MKTNLFSIDMPPIILALIPSTFSFSTPLSTREKGGLLRAGHGTGTGAISASTVGHTGVGALIGAPIGLLGDALIGDKLMGQEEKQQDQQKQIEQSQDGMDRQRQELGQLRRQQVEY